MEKFSPEEIQQMENKAEEVMTDEQKEASEEQEDEILEAKKERILSDAKLVKGGAEYVVDEGVEEPRLQVTDKQISIRKNEPEKKAEEERERLRSEQAKARFDRKWDNFKHLLKVLEEQGAEQGSAIEILYHDHRPSKNGFLVHINNLDLEIIKDDGTDERTFIDVGEVSDIRVSHDKRKWDKGPIRSTSFP